MKLLPETLLLKVRYSDSNTGLVTKISNQTKFLLFKKKPVCNLYFLRKYLDKIFQNKILKKNRSNADRLSKEKYCERELNSIFKFVFFFFLKSTGADFNLKKLRELNVNFSPKTNKKFFFNKLNVCPTF